MALSATVRHYTNARTLTFVTKAEEAFATPTKNILFIGTKAALAEESITAFASAAAQPCIRALISEVAAGASITTNSFDGTSIVKYTIGALPGAITRYHPPARPFAITNYVSSVVDSAKGDVTIIIALEKAEHVLASACAVARCLPYYNRKTVDTAEKAAEGTGTVTVALVHPEITCEQFELAKIAAESVRVANEIIDTPPEEMNTEEFHAYVANWVATSPAAKDKVTLTAIVGDDLKAQSFGGIYGVGKQGTKAPRLVVLTYEDDATKEAEFSAALVGKGIMYDTGGLTLKPNGGVGMKKDCAGAAGFFGAFRAAVESGQYKHIKLHLLLCIAENCIGPDAVRNDDILYMFSGKTVEVNDTDAEGRLVLADGVSYASRIFKPNLIVDMATLTGAQLHTSGKLHAGLLASKGEAERAAVRSAMRSGDAVLPMLYCPEVMRDQCKSNVADMKNYVSDERNCPSSGAAMFIEDHIDDKWKAEPTSSWLHIDMAGPGGRNERGTGFGVALILDLLKHEAQAACKPSY